jgi:nicotinamidase/pyrazinamidase
MAAAYDAQTALVVVDVQNDFADPNGGLYVRGGEEVVEPINQQVQAASDAGAFVVYTQDWHPESTPHFEKDGGVWPVHCVMGTWGAEFHPDLRVDGPVVQKGSDGKDGYSGFSVRDPESGEEEATRLDALLRERGIQRVVVAGLALDYCVKETALDAHRNGYRTEVLPDLTRAVDLQPGDGDTAVRELTDEGVDVR